MNEDAMQERVRSELERGTRMRSSKSASWSGPTCPTGSGLKGHEAWLAKP
jgi:hypothetical protein